MKQVIVVAMLSLVAVLSATSTTAEDGQSVPGENCVLKDNIDPEFVCYRLVDAGFFGSIVIDPRLEPLEEDLVYYGVVSIKPLGLGPFPAVGIGPESSCDMYEGLGECSGPSNGVGIFRVAADGDTCLDRVDIQFRPWQGGPDPSPGWTTIGFYLKETACPQGN